jgi:hypothetical protein
MLGIRLFEAGEFAAHDFIHPSLQGAIDGGIDGGTVAL